MEPFLQVCPTCQSRIRVRNPSMIGQVANCPKCNSMIMIAEPQRILVEGSRGEAADSNTVTKEAIPAFKAPGHQPSDSQPARFNRAGSEPAPTDEQPIVWQPIDKPLLATEEWTSRSTTRSRQILMVVFLGVSGFIIAGGIFYTFIRWTSSSRQRAETASTAPVAQPGSTTTDSSTQDGTAPSAQVVDLLIEPQPGLPLPPEVETNSNSSLASVSGADSISPALPATTAAVPSADTSPTISALSDTAPSEQPVNTSTSSNVTENKDAKQVLPEMLANIQNIFDLAMQPSRNDAGMELSPPPKANANVDSTPTAELHKNDSSPDNAGILDKLLAGEVRGIAISGRSLPDAIAAIVQMTNIPLTIDFDSLAAGGIDRNQQVNFTFQKAKAGELLKRFATGKGLAPQAVENTHVLLRANPELVAKQVGTSLSLIDWLPSGDTAWWQSFMELYADKQGHWQLNDGTLKSDFEGEQDAAWLQAMAMLNAWRGLSTNSSSATSPRTRGATWVEPAALTALSFVCRGQSLEQRPIGQTLVRACREASLQCWLDWPSLIRQGLTPDSTALTVTRDRPLKDILSAYARRHDLLFAFEDRNTILVTTANAHASQLRSYVRPAEGKSAAEWQEEISAAMPTNSAAKRAIRTLLSPDAKYVLIRSPRPVLTP